MQIHPAKCMHLQYLKKRGVDYLALRFSQQLLYKSANGTAQVYILPDSLWIRLHMKNITSFTSDTTTIGFGCVLLQIHLPEEFYFCFITMTKRIGQTHVPQWHTLNAQSWKAVHKKWLTAPPTDTNKHHNVATFLNNHNLPRMNTGEKSLSWLWDYFFKFWNALQHRKFWLQFEEFLLMYATFTYDFQLKWWLYP